MGFWAGYLLDSRLLWLGALNALCGLCNICAFGFGWVWVGWLFACEGLLVQCCLLAGVSFGEFGVLWCLF